MNALLERQMYKYALMYANKMNGKTGLRILDERDRMPIGASNAGAWYGFTVGFKMCYFLLTNAKDIENAITSAKTTSDNETVSTVQDTKEKTP